MNSTAKILLVEDDEMMLALSSKMLLDAGFDINSALKPGDAIKLLTGHKYDLVVLDISMPTLSGFDFVQLMESFHIDSKIVFLTNMDDEETLRKVKKIKINRLISKEKELHRLPEIIREVLALA